MLVISLIEGVRRKLDHQAEPTLDHLPLVEVEAGDDCKELTEVILGEGSVERVPNHMLHPLHRRCPNVVPLSIDLEVDLELLKQPHQVVQVLWKWQVENLLLDVSELLLVISDFLVSDLLLHCSWDPFFGHLCSLDHFVRSRRLICNGCLVL